MRTETVAVALTDVVGSTELASRLGHGAYEALRREHFQLLRTVLAAHRGTEVKSTGDGLMIAFASAVDAVDCCVAMQQALERSARRATGPTMQARIGLSIGEVTREDGDLYGTAVVEAVRLCAAAESGQVIVSELIRLMVRGYVTHTITSIGARELKGRPEPVPACTVHWEPLRTRRQLLCAAAAAGAHRAVPLRRPRRRAGDHTEELGGSGGRGAPGRARRW
jgi:class 3 adenylate cyclase